MYRYELIKGLYYIVEENEIKKGRFINCECLWRLSISERSPPISLTLSLSLSYVCVVYCRLTTIPHITILHPTRKYRRHRGILCVCVCMCMHVLVCMSVCGRTCVHSLTEKIRGNNPPPPPPNSNKHQN